MTPLFRTITKSWKAFITQKRLLPLVVLVDVLFIYGLTRLHYEVFNRASMIAMQLTAMMAQQVQEIAAAEQAKGLAVLQSAEFLTAYHQLVKYIALFFGAAFLIWVVAKGIVWFVAHKSVQKKVDARQFILKFIGMNAFWFALFIAITAIGLNLLDYALFGVFPLIGKAAANTLVVLSYWVLAYFVFISYALVPHTTFKPTFVLGVKAWKELVPVHLVSSLVFFVATTVPASLLKLNIYLSLAFVVLLALPGIAWARVFWSTAVHNVRRQHEQA